MMKARTFRLSFLLLPLAFAACGPSQSDFDKMKQQVQQLVSERDTVKSQLEEVRTKVAALDQQVTNLQAAAAPKPDTVAQNTTTTKLSKKKARRRRRH